MNTHRGRSGQVGARRRAPRGASRFRARVAVTTLAGTVNDHIASPHPVALAVKLPPELVLVEGLRDALALLTGDWKITYLNARARRGMTAVGLDPQAVIGHSLWDTFPFLNGTAASTEFARVRAGEGPAQFELHDAAAQRWFEVDAMLAGEQIAICWRDVTASRRSEE